MHIEMSISVLSLVKFKILPFRVGSWYSTDAANHDIPIINTLDVIREDIVIQILIRSDYYTAELFPKGIKLENTISDSGYSYIVRDFLCMTGQVQIIKIVMCPNLAKYCLKITAIEKASQ